MGKFQKNQKTDGMKRKRSLVSFQCHWCGYRESKLSDLAMSERIFWNTVETS